MQLNLVYRFHLREHMNQHDDNRPYSCEQCGKAFYKRIQLRQHKLSHGSNRHTCSICGATFNRRGNMNAHMKRHNNDNGGYTCSVGILSKFCVNYYNFCLYNIDIGYILIKNWLEMIGKIVRFIIGLCLQM